VRVLDFPGGDRRRLVMLVDTFVAIKSRLLYGSLKYLTKEYS
jgi:hypothetical protein